MRILMIGYSSGLMDGINRHILTISQGLAKQGITVAYCSVSSKGDIHSRLERAGIEAYGLDCPHGHSLNLIPRFKKVLKTFRPDVLHFHEEPLMLKIASSSVFRRLKTVKTIHGIGDEHITTKSLLEKVFSKVFDNKYDAICYISNGVRRYFKAENLEDSFVVYNPIRFDEGFTERETLHKLLHLPSHTKIVGTACRFAAVKNPEAFTEVMCRVLLLYPDSVAVVMGDGDEETKQHLYRIVEKYSLVNRFFWLGYRSDAPELVSELDCFIMTSNWEGLPTSLLEAISLRTPIAFLQGEGGMKDLEELNTNEGPFAIVANKNDYDGLANGVLNLLRDRTLAESYATKAFEVGKRHFEVEAAVKRLIDIYNGVL